MKIAVKSEAQLETMRRAGRIVAETLAIIAEKARPGISTGRLDQFADEHIRQSGAIPSFKGYLGYPRSICTSPNDVIVHGIPGDYKLKSGDILGVDCGAIFDGWHGDAALTLAIGEVRPEALKLMAATAASLAAGIRECMTGRRLGDIGHSVQRVAESAGFSVVRDYVGHGIGTAMHEEPQVPNYGPPGKGEKLKRGNVLAIEPMVNIDGPATKVMDDGWTVVTRDGALSAHFEHTVVVGDAGPEILTILDDTDSELMRLDGN